MAPGIRVLGKSVPGCWVCGVIGKGCEFWRNRMEQSWYNYDGGGWRAESVRSYGFSRGHQKIPPRMGWNSRIVKEPQILPPAFMRGVPEGRGESAYLLCKQAKHPRSPHKWGRQVF